MKKLVAAALAAVAFATADACTGIYVGKKVSVEGNVLIGRTIDSSKAVVGTQTFCLYLLQLCKLQ